MGVAPSYYRAVQHVWYSYDRSFPTILLCKRGPTSRVWRRCVHTQEALLLDGNDGNARAGRCSPAMLLCDTVSANCSHPHHDQVMSALAVFMEIMWKR